MKRFLLAVALAAMTFVVNAQTWDDTGNPTVIPGTNFLGSINDAPLDVKTYDIRRFSLLSDATYAIGSFATEVKNGSLLLSPDVDHFYSNGGYGPFSLLHLADGVGDNSPHCRKCSDRAAEQAVGSLVIVFIDSCRSIDLFASL